MHATIRRCETHTTIKCCSTKLTLRTHRAPSVRARSLTTLAAVRGAFRSVERTCACRKTSLQVDDECPLWRTLSTTFSVHRPVEHHRSRTIPSRALTESLSVRCLCRARLRVASFCGRHASGSVEPVGNKGAERARHLQPRLDHIQGTRHSCGSTAGSCCCERNRPRWQLGWALAAGHGDQSSLDALIPCTASRFWGPEWHLRHLDRERRLL